MNQDKLLQLKNHSVFVGSDPDLVQASGGNTSWKNGSSVWVKGSGKRLKDANDEEIFSTVNVRTLNEDEIADCQDFSMFSSNSISPSIETNFHILIRNECVTHLHSLGAISIGISDEIVRAKIADLGISFVPYARPGAALAQAIRKVDGFQEKILVLQNHGVIFSDVSCRAIEKKNEIFENAISDLFDNLQEQPHLPGWKEILISGVLTPDEAVFLGKTPFVKSDSQVSGSIAISKSGELLFPPNFSSDRIELAHFYVRVAKKIEKKTQVNYLSSYEVDSLVSWEKEIKRIEMADRCN